MCDAASYTFLTDDNVKCSPETADDIKEEDDDYDAEYYSDESMDDLDFNKADEPIVTKIDLETDVDNKIKEEDGVSDDDYDDPSYSNESMDDLDLNEAYEPINNDVETRLQNVIKKEDGALDDDYDDPSFSNESMDDLDFIEADKPIVKKNDEEACVQNNIKEEDGVSNEDYENPSISDESKEDLDSKKAHESIIVTHNDVKILSVQTKQNTNDVVPVFTTVGIRFVPAPKEKTQDAIVNDVPAKSKTPEKLFACKTCGEQFTSSKAATSHEAECKKDDGLSDDDGVSDDENQSISDESVDDLDLNRTDEPTVDVENRSVQSNQTAEKAVPARIRLLPASKNSKTTQKKAEALLNKCKAENVVPVHTSIGIRFVPVSSKVAQDADPADVITVPTKSETSETVTKTVEKSFACQTCGKRFASSKAADNHERTHERLECRICQKVFARRDSLKMHMDAHAGKKPFVCDVCGKRYVRDSLRQKHYKSAHIARPSVAYRCEICNATYFTKSGLIRHQLSHTGERPYKCDKCDKTFIEKLSLKLHYRTHTGFKPYECGVCNKRFTRENNLKEHSRVHTDERPYQCEFCQKRFKTISHIIQHMAVHGKGKKGTNGKKAKDVSPV